MNTNYNAYRLDRMFRDAHGRMKKTLEIVGPAMQSAYTIGNSIIGFGPLMTGLANSILDLSCQPIYDIIRTNYRMLNSLPDPTVPASENLIGIKNQFDEEVQPSANYLLESADQPSAVGTAWRYRLKTTDYVREQLVEEYASNVADLLEWSNVSSQGFGLRSGVFQYGPERERQRLVDLYAETREEKEFVDYADNFIVYSGSVTHVRGSDEFPHPAMQRFPAIYEPYHGAKVSVKAVKSKLQHGQHSYDMTIHFVLSNQDSMLINVTYSSEHGNFYFNNSIESSYFGQYGHPMHDLCRSTIDQVVNQSNERYQISDPLNSNILIHLHKMQTVVFGTLSCIPTGIMREIAAKFRKYLGYSGRPATYQVTVEDMLAINQKWVESFERNAVHTAYSRYTTAYEENHITYVKEGEDPYVRIQLKPGNDTFTVHYYPAKKEIELQATEMLMTDRAKMYILEYGLAEREARIKERERDSRF